jgi:hypothetical protein
LIHKVDFTLITPSGEKVITMQGDRGPYDMKIFSQFPSSRPWAHSMYYVGLLIRLKGEVEDRNYRDTGKGSGREYLWNYFRGCMFSDTPIRLLCEKYKIKIPQQENGCKEDVCFGRFTNQTSKIQPINFKNKIPEMDISEKRFIADDKISDSSKDKYLRGRQSTLF